MSITVGELKEFLKGVSDDLNIDFCIGDSFGYEINKVYEKDGQVWMDNDDE